MRTKDAAAVLRDDDVVLDPHAVEIPPGFEPVVVDERLAGLPLGVKRVELLLQPLLGGLAGLDGAADDLQLLHDGRAHAAPFTPTLKNKKPFQREPDFGVTSVNYSLAELLARAEAPR